MHGKLYDIYLNLDGALSHKWRHYFEIYERYFSKFVGKPVTILEIGVQDGGSLHMWRRYFGDQAKIIGVDISPYSKKLENDGFQIEIGDQGSAEFLRTLRNRIGEVDIIVDDGSHRPNHQILGLNELFPIVREGGFYLCEDVYNSYLYKTGAFIEYAKGLIDELHGWWESDLVGQTTYPTRLTKSCGGIYFHDGIVVLEKAAQDERFDLISGDFSTAPPKGKPPPEGPYLTKELLASLPRNADGTVSFHQAPVDAGESRALEDFPPIGDLTTHLSPKTLYTPVRASEAWLLCWGEPFRISETGLLVDGFVRSQNYFLAEPGTSYVCEFFVRANSDPSNGLPLTFYAGPIALGENGKIIQRAPRQAPVCVADGLVSGRVMITANDEAKAIYIGIQGPVGDPRADSLPCFEHISLSKQSVRK